ncbi:MAG TPA: NAD(P)H-binding protein [Stackebrandtia sp.]|jgi:putative NADH-flavin reductase|uniref:NAD(P)-dependent oxidoreductase n=1 Tax=Stackebrandtia sp. TaxID=2023065 RepID=UPI002D65AEE9|nr:NAD(P)H-binding protein [Stackebrandtia sp.]HZE38344.1 NAD(P)H-binding protein [Stackebrandtia sp.]
MKLAVVAATGGVGRQLLDQAVAAGHEVTAVVRSPRKLAGAPVRTLAADLSRPNVDALAAGLAGCDAVLSGLGARSKSDTGVAARGTEAVARAMRLGGVRRIAVVSAAPIGTVASPGNPNPPRHDPGDGFLIRHLASPMIKRILREHYADLARMEDLLRDSDLEWTIVRPPRLTDAAATGEYRTAVGRNLRRGVTISRADVAGYMLGCVGDPAAVGRVIGIAY